MAKSGSFSKAYYRPSDGLKGYTYRIDWSATQSIAANTSTIECKHYLVCEPSWGLYSNARTHSCTINGTKKNFTTSSISTSGGTTITLGSTEHTVNHNSDGTGSFSLTGVCSMQATISGNYVDNITVTGNDTLDTIPRASSLTAGNGTLDTAQTLKITRAASTFRHTLTYTCGTANGTILAKTSSATSVSWTPPIALAEQASASSKTVSVTLTLKTYTSSTSTTDIGSVTKDITLTIPEKGSTKPTITDVKLVPINDSLDSVFASQYIQGYSKVKATITAKGAYGATIASYKTTIEGVSKTGNTTTSNILQKSGNVTVSCIVTDTRGFTSAVYEKEIPVVAYGPPQVIPHADETEIICARCLEDGSLSEEGTYLKIKAKRTWYSLAGQDGNTCNFCELRYRHKAEGADDFCDWITLLEKDSIYSVDQIFSGIVPSVYTAYVVEITAIDDIGRKDTKTFNIGTANITLHLAEGGGGVGIGMYSSGDGLDVAFPSHFYEDVSGRVLGLGNLPLISEESDVDDCTEPGAFGVESDAVAKTLLNLPMKSAGTLRVYRSTGTTPSESTVYGIQEFVSKDGKSRFSRNMQTNDIDGEWSFGEWVSYDMLTTRLTEYETDYGTWSYKKYADGTYEMWGYFTVTPTSSTALGNMYYSEQFAIPTPFTVDTAIVSGNSANWCLISAGGLASTDPNNNIGFRLLRPTAISGEVSVRLFVKGTY